MKQQKQGKKLIMLMVVVGWCVSSYAGSASYPDAALNDVLTQEQIAEKKAEALEAKAAINREAYEKRQREVERLVTEHKYYIDGLLMRQEKAQSELDSLSTELSGVNTSLQGLAEERAKIEADSQGTLDYLDTLQAEIKTKQSEMAAQYEAISKARREAELSIYSKSTELQRMKTDMGQTETRVQEAEATRAAIEANEMRVRTEWMQTKLQVADKNQQRKESLDRLAEAKGRFAKASNDLVEAKKLLALAEKNRVTTAKQTAAQVATYEQDIVRANKNVIRAESERIRLDTEVDKLKSYASRIKDSRDTMVDREQDTQGLVLRSKVAVETARAELSNGMESSVQADFKQQKLEAQARGLAAAGEATEMFGGAKKFVMTGNCKSYARPQIGSTSADSYSSGANFMARETGDSWIEVIKGNGRSSYIESRCGHFEN